MAHKHRMKIDTEMLQSVGYEIQIKQVYDTNKTMY